MGKIATIAGLVLLGISVVGGVGFGLYTLISGLGGGPGRFAWLPDNTEIVVELRPAEIWRAGVLQPLTSGELGQRIQGDAQKQLGMEFTQLDRVLIGGRVDAKTPVFVMSATAPLDQQKLVDLLSQGAAADHAGHALYPVQDGVMFFPDPTTLVRGPEADVKAAIDRQGVCPAADKLAQLPSGRQLAMFTTNLKNSLGNTPAAFAQMGAGSVQPASLSVGVEFTTDIAVLLSCQCQSGEDAAALVADMQKQRDEGLTQIQAQKSQLVPNPFIDVAKLQGLLTGVEAALQSYQPAVNGDTVTAELTLPGSVVKDGADMFAMFAPMLGGLGGGTSPPAGLTPPSGSESSPGAESPDGESPASENP